MNNQIGEQPVEKTVLEIGSLVRGGVAVSYGEKVAVDGHEMVPVALAIYGFGGGGAGGAANGGGGGGYAIPVGAYVAQNGELHFEPNVVALCAVSIPIVVATGHMFSRIIRAFRSGC